MTERVCPYCRAPIAANAEDGLICEGCETPHHRDCYEENRGCTVFGCRCAPADEPKVIVSTPELTRSPEELTVSRPVRMTPSAFSPLGLSTLSVEGAAGPIQSEVAPQHKSKTNFVLLGALLGAFGAHNFYAGYVKKAIAQLCLTVFTLGYGIPMSWLWAIIEVCTVEQDSKGIQFKS